MEPSFLLHIDTATQVCSVALSANGSLIQEKTILESNKHTEKVNLLIEEILQHAQIKVTDLNGISVAIGPGSYTGLRVGLSVAKGLAFGLGIPIIEINTLLSLAFPHRDKGKYILSALDARRKEVYMNIFKPNLEPLTDTYSYIISETTHPSDWPNPTDLIICGPAAKKMESLLDPNGYTYEKTTCIAANQVDLAYQLFLKGVNSEIAYIKPLYLKPPNITKSTKKAF